LNKAGWIVEHFKFNVKNLKKIGKRQHRSRSIYRIAMSLFLLVGLVTVSMIFPLTYAQQINVIFRNSCCCEERDPVELIGKRKKGLMPALIVVLGED
jgi:hypothetical protein